MDSHTPTYDSMAVLAELKKLYLEKKSALIENNLENLKIVDEKILKHITLIKSLELNPNPDAKPLILEIIKIDNINKALVQQGMQLAEKKLQTIINLATEKTASYSKQGVFICAKHYTQQYQA